MSRAALVLRPEPGASHTAARLESLGIAVRRQPLFAVVPVAWTVPEPGAQDALLLTSANAVRHAGPGLHALAGLPVLAVGEATAAAATAAGLSVTHCGSEDAAALVLAAQAQGHTRLLHLAGRDRVVLAGIEQVTVYTSDPLPIAAATVQDWAGHVALLHSRRAATRLAALVDDATRATMAVAAISDAVAEAAGTGWAARAAAARPTDAALVALVRELIDRSPVDADKLRA